MDIDLVQLNVSLLVYLMTIDIDLLHHLVSVLLIEQMVHSLRYPLLSALTDSKTPPQNSAEAKKLDGDQLSVKSDCSTNNQWG